MAIVDGLSNNAVFLRSLATNIDRWRVIGSAVRKLGMPNKLFRQSRANVGLGTRYLVLDWKFGACNLRLLLVNRTYSFWSVRLAPANYILVTLSLKVRMVRELMVQERDDAACALR